MIANYHTHTPRCHHASGTEREYIEQAIARGLQVLGFSDHAPYPFADGYYSGYRMELRRYADYAATIRGLAEEYKDRITVYLGLEAEYFPRFFQDFLALADTEKPDYLILGQHFLGNELDAPYSGHGFGDPSYLEWYTRQVIAAMETGRFAYVAHPDLLRYTGPLTDYRREARKLCEASLHLNVPLEINFLGLRDHRHYPREDFFQVAGEVGCPVIFGCDAHSPDAVAIPADVAAAEAMVRRYSLRLWDTLPGLEGKPEKLR